MILRAAFFLALVYVLTPHEPDLGLGRPGSWLPQAVSVARGAADCTACNSFDAAFSGLMPRRSLADIKSEIGAALRARRDRPS